MKKLLVVEDDSNIKNILNFNLKRNNFEVICVEDGVEALKTLQKVSDIDLILMDVMMPNMNGFDCTIAIRKISAIPIVMITALEDEANLLKGFECGVDDYIIKPFSLREVIARINANIRKTVSSTPLDTDLVSMQNTTINTSTHTAIVCGNERELSNTEYNLLMYFYKVPNKVITREVLLREVWGYSFGDSRTVDVAVRRLREKIEIDPSNPKIIKTRKGLGYYYNLK